MNRKQLSVLMVLAAVLCVAGIMMFRTRQAEWVGGGEASSARFMGDLDVNAVAKITIRQSSNELVLEKVGDLWCVRERGNYPAIFPELSELLLRVRDLKPMQSETVGVSGLAQLELVAPGQGDKSGTLLELAAKDGRVIESFVLGKTRMKKSDRPGPMGEQGYPDGRWVLVGKANTATLVSESLSNVEPKPERWLNKDFFKIERPRSIAVTFPVATNSWTLTRETEAGEWKLADATPDERLDAGKASGVTGQLASPGFVDVFPATSPTVSDALGQPTVVAIETFNNLSYTLKVGGKTNDQYHLSLSVTADLPKERAAAAGEKPEDKERLDKDFEEQQKRLGEKLKKEQAYQNWVYAVSSWTLDPLLKDRAQLFEEKKDMPPPAAAAEPPAIPLAP